MYYVAYGSNMNLEQMKYRCPKSKVVSNGKLKGWKLVFNVHADIIKGNKNDEIPVVVWEIHKNDWHTLDCYEGFPKYYIRENVYVELDSGEIIEAIAYVMTEKRKGICPPDKFYFNICETGCRDNNINPKHLYDALEYSIKNETKFNQYNTRR